MIDIEWTTHFLQSRRPHAVTWNKILTPQISCIDIVCWLAVGCRSRSPACSCRVLLLISFYFIIIRVRGKIRSMDFLYNREKIIIAFGWILWPDYLGHLKVSQQDFILKWKGYICFQITQLTKVCWLIKHY